MASIRINVFGGLAPRPHKTMGDGARATVAENVKLWHGSLDPWREPREILAVPNLKTIRTMHRFECCWVAFDDCCVNIAKVQKNIPYSHMNQQECHHSLQQCFSCQQEEGHNT
jgi:hypothetical protein